MKNFVITIMDNPQSVQVADRCIRTAANHGIEVEKFKAITPKDNLEQILKEEGINPMDFVEKYSRTSNAIAAFLSHYSLWKMCATSGEEFTIFEHDAVVVSPIPEFIPYHSVISLGKPSYGKFNTPPLLGVNQLTSKPYFPGAHAYRLKPNGAKALIAVAQVRAAPTDVFLRLDTFAFLEEYYPWPVEANDSFTTIQKPEGCFAKHNYGETYEII
jgi:GR25 family glycosyltransferase involved in LPS biosynthesis